MPEFPTRSYSLRSVHPEGATAPESLPPVLSNQPDSGDRGHGQRTHLVCHQFDDTCGIVATAFDAWVDVTGASNGWKQTRVDRSHRRVFAGGRSTAFFFETLFAISRNTTFIIARKTHDCPLE